jgi:hypothetical protein
MLTLLELDAVEPPASEFRALGSFDNLRNQRASIGGAVISLCAIPEVNRRKRVGWINLAGITVVGVGIGEYTRILPSSLVDYLGME